MKLIKKTLSVFLAIALLHLSSGAIAQDSASAANRLLVLALQKVVEAAATESGDARLGLLQNAVSLLDKIVADHPETELAVKIVSNQAIGEFTASQIKKELRRAVAQGCTVDPTPNCLGPLATYAFDLEAKLKTQRDLEKQRRAEITSLNSDINAAATKDENRQAQIADLGARLNRALAMRAQELANDRAEIISLKSDIKAASIMAKERQTQIEDLGARLNRALAMQVQELASYRSEFFGRLREVLGARSDVRIVGDRFVFQADTIFETGSSKLSKDGRDQLVKLVNALREVIVSIPPDLDWILSVEGHTDVRPISTPQFSSNWELSVARALSVVNFVVEEGIPPGNLVAAGYGQFRPLDQRDDQIGYRRNRRIEIRLTER